MFICFTLIACDRVRNFAEVICMLFGYIDFGIFGLAQVFSLSI